MNAPIPRPRHPRRARPSQRGITLLGLLFWAVLIALVALVAMRVLPTVNEYYTILRTVNVVAREGGNTVPEIRAAFDKRKQVEYSISSISGKDLAITKENEQIVVSFRYDKEVELFPPVYILIKYEGRSR